MRQTDTTAADDTIAFRSHLSRLQWDSFAFASAARIKVRSASAMYRGERAVPPRLMRWLESMVATADQLPPPPAVDC